ncbi:MAG: OsmC family protein [Bacteroidota bacterium]
MSKQHHYSLHLEWTGNLGKGTSSYRAYSRDHKLMGEGKPPLLVSSDPAFRGNPERYNPEELLVSSLSSCHMLWYLHFCAVGGIHVNSYVDHPEGWMEELPQGQGQFTKVLLQPRVHISSDSDYDLALELHSKAHSYCFIARSVNFPVEHLASISVD